MPVKFSIADQLQGLWCEGVKQARGPCSSLKNTAWDQKGSINFAIAKLEPCFSLGPRMCAINCCVFLLLALSDSVA